MVAFCQLFHCPKLGLTEPLVPRSVFFFVMILMIPAVPSASYLADGEVITSTCLIISAGICFNASETLRATMLDGLLLIRTLILELPRNWTFPSMSTATDG